MCQPLTGTEQNLKLYYKFDQTSGSVVTDYSLYKNHGISRNSDWQISGAAIGDVSTYDYDGSIASDFQVMLSHPTGDSITITGDGDSGYYSGLQLYYVDQAPANFEPPANWTLIDTDHYWGVFPVGKVPTYNIDYNYSGIDSYTIENDIKLTMRNNAAENWQDAAAHLNTTNQTLQKSYHENHSEFVLGQGKTPTIFDIADQTSTKDAVDFSVVDSDGGILTVTVSLGEGSSLTQVSFDVNGSGGSSVTVTTSAGVSADLSLTISRLTNAMGDLTVNVIVTDAQGLTSSTQYQTSFMPGPGYAFQFSDNDYVTVLHDESLSFTQMTLETWINLYNHNASKYPIYKGNDFYIYITSSTIEFYNGSSTFSVNLVIPDDKWVHIACVYDVTQTMYIYVNGLLKFQQASDPGSTLYTAPMYIGSDGSNTIYGTMDETRIWNYGRTAAQIRESMCKKLNGNEPGLVAYYRFDHVDGSVLKDYSIYNNHATMTSIEDASWVISDAPIGDASAFDYTGSAAADFSVALTHTMGDSLYVTGDGGTYSAIHMYRVDDIPNVTTPPANWTFIDPDHYWGVYAVGGSPTFSMSYHYSGNTAITIENDTRLAYRNDASDTTWEDTVSSINTSTKVVSNTELVNGDFIMGAGKAPSIFRVNNQKTAHTPVSITVSDSDGGMLTVTAVSSDVSMISNSMINLAGSGSNSLTLNSTAGVPQSFTITFDQTSTIHGKVIITVMIADSQGLTGTQQFTVLISPPGAGNMLHFIDSNDYIDIPDHTSLDVNQNCTFEFWYKAYTLTTTDQCIFQKSGAYSLEIDNHWIYFNNQTNSYNLNNTVLSINTWYHIAVVIDSSNGCRIFVNGKQQSYQSASNDGGISTSSLRIGNSSYPITGYIDEFRIWGVPRTETQIRDHMCRRLNGDETGLVAYYRFDHTSGTTLLDMTSNGNNGTLYNMVDTQWMGSEAPIGDDSAHDYVGAAASDFQAVYTHSDGDSFTATGESGNYTAMHIYMVNTYPGFGTLPEGWDTLDSNRFYGVFPAALTGCTYSASYGYTGNSYINDKASLKWATRTDASESWDRSEALQDYATGKLELTNQTRSEYILGAGVNPPVVSGLSDLASAGIDEIDFSVSVSDSATVTITTSSSDSSLISNLNINSTGSDELIDSFTANVAQDISLTFDQNASEHGKVSVTVIVSSSEGVATTTTFTVILSPPGSGNALVFDGVDDYVDLGNTDALKQTGAFSYELWMYSSDWASVVGTAFGNTEGSGYALYFNADTILTNVYADGAGYYNANASKSILTNGWHHFAFTFDGQQLSLYIDGDLKTLTNIGSNKTVYHHASNSTLLGAEVGTSNTATGAYVSVIIDELRFWNVARSAAEIRTNMCKKITGSETGLTAYYRFDNSSGTSLIDLSNNNNDGILNNMDNSNWVTSGAAIGDDSAYDYAGSVASDYSVSIAHADGDQFTATGESGTYTGIHVYLVNESPNTTTIPDGYTSMDTDHYYGVFPVGITPTFSVAYNYSGNTYAADDSNLQIAYRTNNAGSWTGFASTQYTSTTTVVKTGISAFSGISATEFILGKNEPPVMVADEEAQSPYFDSLTYHTLAVKDDGTVWAWGKNDNGEVGNGTTTGPQTTPGNVSGLSNVIDVEAGYLFSLAVQDDGTVWEWGENTSISGQTAKSTPVQVTELENIVQVSAGNNHALALKNDGTVWTWGRNDYGQLGIGTTTDEIDPVQISGLNNVSDIYAGSSYSFVLKNDGTVWAWGVNVYGQLGNGNTTNQTSPSQISGLTNVTFISPHSWHTLFLKNDGTVWAVGYNTEGQLGNGTNTDSSTLVQVSGLTNVTQVCAGSQHNIALKDDGTVWVWGKNNYGQLGNGTTTSENEPIQVSGLSNIITLSAGSGHSLAMQSDGTYWAWGKNNIGELGDGTITDRSSPVHITETFITGNAQLSFTTSEDTALTISYSITDAESSACGLTLSMVSSDSSLITDSNFSFTCNADNYIVSITPVEDLYGSATVTIIATDAGGLTDSDSFSIDITEVNDAPTVTSISSLSLTENASSSAITFTITDLESNATDLTVTASSSNTSLVDNSNIVIGGTDASRTISITPTANEYGVLTITISIFDGNLTATTAFVLTINNILEISSIDDQTTLEDTATGAINFALTGVSSGGATIDYSFEYTFGTNGSGADQFNMPKDVALDSSGNIYVADYMNHSIKVFSSPGTFSYSVGTGSMGSGSYAFNFPNAIHIDQAGKIYVVDQGSNSIKIYTSSFVFDYSITTGSPYDVSVDSSGNIFVADTSSGGEIKVYTSDGNYYTSLCADHLTMPKAVAVDSSGKIYVVDSDMSTPLVKVFSSSGAIEYTIGTSSYGSADGQLYDPSGIGVDSSGNIFVGDTMNQRIQIFNSSGSFEYSIGTVGVYGSAAGQFDGPCNLYLDSNDNLYVAELTGSRIQKFTNNAQGGVTLSATSSYTPLVTDANITLGGSGASRTIDILPATDQSGTVTITVTATDGDLTATTSFQLTVTSVNDLPVISSISNYTTAEDTSIDTITFTATDVETAACGLAVTITSSNPSLITDITYVCDTETDTYTLTINPESNQHGLATITVVVGDSGGLTAASSFDLSVTSINDLPVIISDTTLTMNEDETLSFTISATDVETADCSMDFTYSSSNTSLVPIENISYTCTSSGVYYLTITSATNQSGNTLLTITVTDTDNLTSTQAIALTVISVNDAPLIAGGVSALTTNEDTVLTATYIITDIESSACDLTLNIISSDPGLMADSNFTYDCDADNYTLSFTPTTNASGAVTITVIASDAEGLTDSHAFLMTVTEINDGPTFGSQAEMATHALSFTYTTADSTTVSLTVTSSNTSIISDSAINVSGSGTNSNDFSTTANIANTVTIQYTPVANTHGRVILTVTASSFGDTTTQTYAVIVSPPGSGNALNFDGSDDYISLPSISWINGDFTCEAWIYLRSHVQGTRLFDFGNGAPSDNIVLMFMGAGPIQLQVFNGGAQKDFSPNYIIPLFKWIHIAYKIEGTTATFYVNGEQRDYTNDIYAPNNVTRTSNYIAKSNWTNAYPDAIFDEIRFWNTARTETELRDNMCKKLDGNETGLMAYYRFDHSSGTTLADLTGNGNDGTLHNTIDTNWITSGAALGDDSVYDYAGSVFSDFSASIAHADGDQFTATGDGGTYTGIQVYIVNESPNTTTPPDAYTSIDTDHYYGVFPVGVTPTYSIAYDYSGNAYASDDSSLQIAYRTSNSGEWTGMVSTKYTSTTMLVKTGISAFSGISATEFILGMNVPPVFSVPTIGPVDINEGTPYTMTKTITDAESSACGLSLTMTSSDSALFTSTNFTYSCNADTYTIRITPTTHMIGSATVTMIVTDAGGLTASDSFEIAVNPVYYTIAGHVSYYTDIAGSDLEGVTLTLTGTYSYSMVSDAFGYYTFSTVRPGDYTLTASKSDDISLDIADAIKILNACARLNSLTCLEQIAADAYIDGRYNSYDAALVAGYIAGIDTCLNDSCTFWQFLPENIVSCETWPLIEFENVRQYTDLTGDTFGQDFIGIGCGNVSE
jgi:alpha-tubulin suppressor-like RCC1 family protein/sugar lactone lactonase YvrE/uncharacterized protein YfcZ (UPF0381/DUF406 family)